MNKKFEKPQIFNVEFMACKFSSINALMPVIGTTAAACRLPHVATSAPKGVFL